MTASTSSAKRAGDVLQIGITADFEVAGGKADDAVRGVKAVERRDGGHGDVLGGGPVRPFSTLRLSVTFRWGVYSPAWRPPGGQPGRLGATVGAVMALAKQPSESSTTEPLSYTDAAEQLLRAAGKALSHKELAKRATTQKLIVTDSQTPHISMHVSIRSEMKRREQRGEPQRFVFLGDGLFSLVEIEAGTPTEKAKSALEQIRESRKEASSALLKTLTTSNNGPNFELMVADLLVAMGYQAVEVIGGKDDQGVDITCEKRDGVLKTRVAIQCKCRSLSQQIGPKDVSTLRDNLSTYQCQQGILVTTTHLNDTAKKKAAEAGKEPIHYIESDELLDLFAEYGIGVRSEQVKFYQIDASKYDFLK